jgi:hypothetical protein
LIDDETTADANVARIQQVNAARVRTNIKALDFKRELERVADGWVILHDDDNRARKRQTVWFLCRFHLSSTAAEPVNAQKT